MKPLFSKFGPIVFLICFAAACGSNTTTAGGVDVTGTDTNPPAACVDLDKDGVLGLSATCPQGIDCNDNSASTYPGAVDLCGDGIDQDCDGADDPCCNDEDKDGVFAISGTCQQGTDCNDKDMYTYPGATEICGDGIDQDCDGNDISCCLDNDNDGAFGIGATCAAGTDCNDGDATVHPNSPEICDDGKDNDCNGLADALDEACQATCTPDCTEKQCGDDGCGGECGPCAEGVACVDSQCAPETLPGSCAGICGDYIADAPCQCDSFCFGMGDCCDDICDTDVCYEDLPSQCGCTDEDGDGFGAGPECLGADCDDSNADINPDSAEICGNGIDDDCAGDGDEECPVEPCTEESDADGDGYGSATGCDPQDCDDTTDGVYPGAEEICGDEIDQDCDGADEPCPTIDCVDNDGDGYGEGTECLGEDCNDADLNVNPGATQDTCGDNIDQDCDGVDPECEPECVDADNDGYFAISDSCTDGNDCNDGLNTIYPGNEEICGDGFDQDCDGEDLECPATGCTPVAGDPQNTTTATGCDAGLWCNPVTTACEAPKYWEWWAPVIHIDTDADKPGWDLFTTVDYDNDNHAGNNGEHIDDYDKPAVAYYSYVKTDTHAYLGYHFYFPRRWDDAVAFGTDYENDMQSVLIVIRLVEGTMGELEAMFTTAFGYYYQYRAAGTDLNSGSFLWNNEIEMSDEGHHSRPIVYINSQSHAIYGIGWFDGFPEGDGIILDWGFEADSPTDVITEATYSIVPLKDTLWPERLNTGDTKIFKSFHEFAGNDLDEDGSVAPWGKYDKYQGDDDPYGELLYDPASAVVRLYPIGWGAFSTQYTYNPYATRVDLWDLMIWADGGLGDSEADPYIKLYMRDGRGEERQVLGNGNQGLQNNWSMTNQPVGTYINLKTELERFWFYGIQNPGYQDFGIEVRDEDPIFSDGWLMVPQQRVYSTSNSLIFYDFEDSDMYIEVTK